MTTSPVGSVNRTTFALPGGVFHALVAGDRASRPLLFLHGFPDHPPTAAIFLEQLGRTRRVVAPWLRGYAPSPLAGPFDADTLVADVVAMIDELGGSVDLVGHDWGAFLTYGVCVAAPERVRRAVTLALPHPSTFLRALRTWRQARQSWYMALFQLPGAGWLTSARDLALIDRLWRDWSPGFRLDAARRAELHATLAASLPAPLGYYRAMPGALVRGTHRRPSRIVTPLLQLHGADDGCVVPPTEADARQFDHRVLEIVAHTGHFLHLEAPEAIAARVTAWLA